MATIDMTKITEVTYKPLEGAEQADSTRTQEILLEIVEGLCDRCKQEGPPMGPDNLGRYFHGIRTCTATIAWEAIKKGWTDKTLTEVNLVDNIKGEK